MKTLKKYKYLWAIGIFYFLIAFEFFYMASPFAAYFYSVYKPGLKFIENIPCLSWLSGFFMPHLVVDTKSIILNLMPSLGTFFIIVGLLVFIVSATMVYYSKLFKKRAVVNGFYKYIRHPQYSAFILFSFGLLLLWPRYLNLVFFIVMLFVYYMLALKEEKECRDKYGKEYVNYRKKTAMFFPVPGRTLIAPDNISIPKWYKIILVMIVSIVVSLTIASGIKALSVRQLYSWFPDGVSWISIYEKSDEEFSSLDSILRTDTNLWQLIKSENETAGVLINYVLPVEMYISEIPMEEPDSAPCHVRSVDFNQDLEKVIVTKGINISKKPISLNRKLRKTIRLEPFLEIWIDSNSGKILKIITPRDTNRYGSISHPVF